MPLKLASELSAELKTLGIALSGSGTTTSGGDVVPGQERVAPGEVKCVATLEKVDPQRIIGIHMVDVAYMSELAVEIKEKGYLEQYPVLLVDTALGYLCLDGHHRSHTAMMLELKEIPAWVVSSEDFQALLNLRFGGALPDQAKKLDRYIWTAGHPYNARTKNDHSKFAAPSSIQQGRSAVSAGREHFTLESYTCAVAVDKALKFNGKTYTPDEAKAYVVATMLTSLPVSTNTLRAWTAATIANSAQSACDQLIDREHRLVFYAAQRGATQDDVIGHICDIEFPSKKKAVELAADGEGVPLRILYCLYRKVQGVEAMLPDIASGLWKLSQECEYSRQESAFFDGKTFYPWTECSDEMKACLGDNPSAPVAPFTNADGKSLKLVFCPGGEDGEVLFSGCATTKYPRDKTAKNESIAAAEVRPLAGLDYREKSQMLLTSLFESLVCAEAWRGEDAPDELFAYVPAEAKGKDGKKSLRKFPLASKARKGLDPAILRNALARFSQAALPAAAKAGVKAKILSAVKRWNVAHAAQKIEVSEKSGGKDEFEVSGCMFAGCTSAADGPGLDGKTLNKHHHAIMANGLVMPEGGHSHGLEISSIDLGEGVLCGITTSAYDYLTQPAVPGDATYSGGSAPRKFHEHRHVVRLTKDTATNGETDVTGALTYAVSSPALSGGGKEAMQKQKLQELCAALRSRAVALKDKDADSAALLEAQATELESAVSADDVQATIDAKIKAGELFPKTVHEQAVSAAKQAGKTELQAEISAKAEADAKQAEATKTRMERVVSAGLKAETVQSAVSAIPVGPDGDKAFEAQLATWTSILSSGKAPGKKDSTQSAGTPPPPAHGLGAGEGAPAKPAADVSMGLL